MVSSGDCGTTNVQQAAQSRPCFARVTQFLGCSAGTPRAVAAQARVADAVLVIFYPPYPLAVGLLLTLSLTLTTLDRCAPPLLLFSHCLNACMILDHDGSVQRPRPTQGYARRYLGCAGLRQHDQGPGSVHPSLSFRCDATLTTSKPQSCVRSCKSSNLLSGYMLFCP